MAEENIKELETKDSKVKKAVHKVTESRWFQLGVGALIGVATWEGGKALVGWLFGEEPAAEATETEENSEAEDMPF